MSDPVSCSRMAYLFPIEARTKREAAIEFRRKVVVEYERWYRGEVASLFGEPSPAPDNRLRFGTPRENAILTWAERHQQPKYRRTLQLAPDALRGMTVLDLGSGGIPSGLAFADCEVVCVEPLLGLFRELGYPFRHYSPRARFVQGHAESMPIVTNRMDGVISVNAIDHVDDLVKTASEIRRVLKPSGLLRIHVHYHAPTVLEPLGLDDDVITQEFGWYRGLRKLHEWSEPDDNAGERHTLWGR